MTSQETERTSSSYDKEERCISCSDPSGCCNPFACCRKIFCYRCYPFPRYANYEAKINDYRRAKQMRLFLIFINIMFIAYFDGFYIAEFPYKASFNGNFFSGNLKNVLKLEQKFGGVEFVLYACWRIFLIALLCGFGFTHLPKPKYARKTPCARHILLVNEDGKIEAYRKAKHIADDYYVVSYRRGVSSTREIASNLLRYFFYPRAGTDELTKQPGSLTTFSSSTEFQTQRPKPGEQHTGSSEETNTDQPNDNASVKTTTAATTSHRQPPSNNQQCSSGVAEAARVSTCFLSTEATVTEEPLTSKGKQQQLKRLSIDIPTTTTLPWAVEEPEPVFLSPVILADSTPYLQVPVDASSKFTETARLQLRSMTSIQENPDIQHLSSIKSLPCSKAIEENLQTTSMLLQEREEQTPEEKQSYPVTETTRKERRRHETYCSIDEAKVSGKWSASELIMKSKDQVSTKDSSDNEEAEEKKQQLLESIEKKQSECEPELRQKSIKQSCSGLEKEVVKNPESTAEKKQMTSALADSDMSRWIQRSKYVLDDKKEQLVTSKLEREKIKKMIKTSVSKGKLPSHGRSPSDKYASKLPRRGSSRLRRQSSSSDTSRSKDDVEKQYRALFLEDE